jgi:hypothetical protein
MPNIMPFRPGASPTTPYDDRTRNLGGGGSPGTYNPTGNSNGVPQIPQPPGMGTGGWDPARLAAVGGVAPQAPALDQGATWNSYADVRNAAANPGSPPPGMTNPVYNPITGQWQDAGDPTNRAYWNAQPAGAEAAFDAARTKAMDDAAKVGNPYGGDSGFGPAPPAPYHQTVTPAPNQSPGAPPPQIAPPPGTTPPPPGAPPPAAPPAAAPPTQNPLQQQLGLDDNAWAQLMQYLSNQALGPNYSTGGN